MSRAPELRVTLDVLEAGLTTGELDTRQATSESMRCVEEASFLDGPAGRDIQHKSRRHETPGLKA